MEVIMMASFKIIIFIGDKFLYGSNLLYMICVFFIIFIEVVKEA